MVLIESGEKQGCDELTELIVASVPKSWVVSVEREEYLLEKASVGRAS